MLYRVGLAVERQGPEMVKGLGMWSRPISWCRGIPKRPTSVHADYADKDVVVKHLLQATTASPRRAALQPWHRSGAFYGDELRRDAGEPLDDDAALQAPAVSGSCSGATAAVAQFPISIGPVYAQTRRNALGRSHRGVDAGTVKCRAGQVDTDRL